ncbi:MAG: hypothetical protein AB7D36_09970 [Oscillospiraceae bacterium]
MPRTAGVNVQQGQTNRSLAGAAAGPFSTAFLPSQPRSALMSYGTACILMPFASPTAGAAPGVCVSQPRSALITSGVARCAAVVFYTEVT